MNPAGVRGPHLYTSVFSMQTNNLNPSHIQMHTCRLGEIHISASRENLSELDETGYMCRRHRFYLCLSECNHYKRWFAILINPFFFLGDWKLGKTCNLESMLFSAKKYNLTNFIWSSDIAGVCHPGDFFPPRFSSDHAAGPQQED